MSSSPRQKYGKLRGFPNTSYKFTLKGLFYNISALVIVSLLLGIYLRHVFNRWAYYPVERTLSDYPTSIHGTPPLVMRGGDPYIRALMRTITASEANDPQPYTIIYGGQHVSDLRRHPEICVPIVAGPNVGKCSTAAGRYQFLDITWKEKAQRYHPRPSGFLFWKQYSFEAHFQDAVVHDWLKDSRAWGMNIPKELRQGNLDKVLRRLSGTWTSLGYGIETNSMSKHLPKVYERMIEEELNR
ncbi:glycoside hydrolase family protein [Moorena producens JHB]|uniref:Glycoside hydrolase family protein n=1 Tax=Moorena producens (strain JHB) TaxID=1454205 RepID=A0A1D9GB03_MOOP1|nr:glycoside hydrolase family protein [Moorena producens]AOY84826.2 glycoside hydrolase family protein [Moorena producens JHB]